MKTRRVVSALFSIGLLVGLTVWIGPQVLLQQFAALRWVLPLVVGLGFLKHLLRTWAWRQALAAEGVTLSFGELLKVRIASQAVAYFSSMGLLISEPMKPWLLRKSAAPRSTIPATLLEAGIYWFTSLLVTTAGTFVVLRLVATRQSVAMMSAIWVAIFAAVIALMFARTPLTSRLAGFVEQHSWMPQRLASGLRKAGDMESRIRSFRHRHPRATLRILVADGLVQVVMFAEVWVVLATIGVGVSFALLLAIEAASRVVKMLGFFVPGRVGADEAGAAGSFILLGLPASAGLTLAIARRVGGLAWAGVGLVWLSHSRGSAAGRGAPTGQRAPVEVPPATDAVAVEIWGEQPCKQ